MAKKHPLLLNPDTTCLIIIDMQSAILEEIMDSESIVKKASILAKCATRLNIPIITSEHNPKIFGSTSQDIKNSYKYKPLAKLSFSILQDNEIANTVKKTGAKQILACGIETHICVGQSALDLLANEYQVHIVSDATSSSTQVDRSAGLDKMSKAGAIICTTEMALFELCQSAGTDVFRNILPLIKQNRVLSKTEQENTKSDGHCNY